MSDANLPCDRRAFMKSAGALAVTAGVAPSALANCGKCDADGSPCTKLGWEMCCQLYTFRRFAFYDALEMIHKIGFHAIENRHYVTDIHATVLRQLGLDPRRLEVPGQKRLEIDYGQPIHDIIS